jgi:hypothetical protein
LPWKSMLLAGLCHWQSRLNNLNLSTILNNRYK